MRKVLERYLIGNKSLSVFPAGKAVYVESGNSYGLNGILANQLVFYNKQTGVSVGAGITYATTPNLVIAQGIDTNGDGIAEVLRLPGGDYLTGDGIYAITAEPPSCGAIKILDVGIGCVKKGESYTLTIEAKNDWTQSVYNYNEYQRYTETVKFGWDKCDDCDDSIPCKEVACALANKFNGTDRNIPVTRIGGQLKRARAHQDKDKPFTVYVLHENDYEYCFNTVAEGCVGCNTIPAITGFIFDGVTYEIALTTMPNDPTKTNVSQIDRILKQINDVLFANTEGHALRADTFIGSAKPCCDGVKLLVNSCKEFSLLGEGGAVIAPCATGLPTYEVQTKGHCGGCSDVAVEKPCAYLRVVPKPIALEKLCNTPDAHSKTLYTDIRVTTSYNHNNFGFFRVFEKQGYEIPSGLAYQLIHDVYHQDTSGNQPYSSGYNEWFGKYHQLSGTSRFPAMLKGLLDSDAGDSFSIVNIEYAIKHKEQRTQGDVYEPRMRLTLLIPFENTALITEVEGILNPWITSLPRGFQPISLTIDQDQIETIMLPDGTITTQGYPNANGTLL